MSYAQKWDLKDECYWFWTEGCKGRGGSWNLKNKAKVKIVRNVKIKGKGERRDQANEKIALKINVKTTKGKGNLNRKKEVKITIKIKASLQIKNRITIERLKHKNKRDRIIPEIINDKRWSLHSTPNPSPKSENQNHINPLTVVHNRLTNQ